ncbi:interleukin-12 subunit alpha [Neopsephotus bourkii]|uniref:interleukin-12 subunit alpha n=1 Tax=Neopsephotus bourkii TaxID=309878 RepID=UPI002AA5DC20|nr:interleukin-12 subunit alpha [Neopsephotus bourkii]
MEQHGSAGSSGPAAPRSAAVRSCRQRPGLWALLPALCLALALPDPAWALPTPPAPRHRLADELIRSQELLAAANASLHRVKELGTLGFECTLEEVDLEDITKNQMNTITACTSKDPATGNCPVLERSTFDMNKCLQGIHKDLNAYRAALKNFNDQEVLATIDEMMKALKTGSGSAPQPLAGTGLTSFKGRMRLCSILHAFQIRTVTIDRMMNYLTSLESAL